MGVKPKIKRSQGYDFMPCGQAFEEFIAEKEALNLAASTIRNYRQSYEYFMKYNGYDEDVDLEEISASDFYSWINSMKLGQVKHTSINHYLRDARAFFYWCMDSDRGYMQPFKIKMIEGQEETVKFFPDEELEILLEKPARNAHFSEWRTWAVVNWVLATANRASTICKVKIGDIDFKAKEILLAHTKNKRVQTVPLSSALNTVLKEYIRMWRSDSTEEDYLFCNIGDEKLTTSGLAQAFSKYCKDRGIEQTNIHGLRHNFAKGWIKNNGNMAKLQQILGHATMEMTRKYVKLFGEDIKEDFDKFSPLDNIKRSSKRTQAVKRNLY